jgi:RNA polymerase sigma-70 factor (ECF subfamily)
MILSDNEKSTLEALYTLYEKPMYHIAYAVLHNKNHAEDCVHMSFLNLIKLLHKIEPDLRSPRNKAFVCTVTKYAAYNLKKQITRQDILYTNLPDEKGYTETDIEAEALENINYNALTKAMYEAGYEQANILMIKYAFGLKNKEIAMMMGISLANVKIRLYRAKKIMRDNNKIRSFWGGDGK